MDSAARADFRQRSLTARVLRAVLALFLIGGVLLTLTAWMNGAQAARQAYDRLLLGAAADIAEAIRIQAGRPVVDLPSSAFELLAQAPDDRIAYAVRGPGNALLTGHPDAPPPRQDREGAPRLFDGEMQGEDARFAQFARRFAERDFSGVVTITIGQTTRARQAMALDLAVDALIPAVLAGIALLLSAFFVVRSALRPLQTIADDLRQRDPYDLTPMDTTEVPAEVGVIVNAMNGFMRRLERQVATMQNLISDTAHQLRTPVAAIRAQAEMAAETEPDVAARETFEQLAQRANTLGVLLDRLLSRALVIHRTDSAPRAPVDLRHVALEVIEARDHEVLAPDVEVELVVDEVPAVVRADEFSLVQAASNLLANALTHGRPPVRMGVVTSETVACLWVEDAGEGPDPDTLDRLGHRFERSASSRENGAGLGLSIVTAVAEAFDGRVEMEHREGSFRVSLCLPLAPEGEP
ncbi:sensor histidine kinase [Tropicimonas isoalkanivorans]|uniref:histidine kinase n=1 Tax=Tropicimonas isoalkanivorans TaxID=441112 RepID=A0A1I1QZ00_9RHOB|nr:sensor histidine kinase [Tropicimonas isoalkanivorans]SFD27212.1 two-component system, OmpR family, sensor histidine kinase TctE [Tropicimonas isoalkanivorans]